MALIIRVRRHTFYFIAIKDWNKLPMELKTCENIPSFKQRVKKHLLQKATVEADRDLILILLSQL